MRVLLTRVRRRPRWQTFLAIAAGVYAGLWWDDRRRLSWRRHWRRANGG
jgi:hypothetical protein